MSCLMFVIGKGSYYVSWVEIIVRSMYQKFNLIHKISEIFWHKSYLINNSIGKVNKIC